MSYDLKLFRKEIRRQYGNDFSFLENEEDLEPFTEKQKETIRRRLKIYGYQIEDESGASTTFNFRGGELGITAFMSNTSLTFSCAGRSQEGLFEILQTSDELSDSEFLTLNLQEGAWSGMCLEDELEKEKKGNSINESNSVTIKEAPPIKQSIQKPKPWWKFW